MTPVMLHSNCNCIADLNGRMLCLAGAGVLVENVAHVSTKKDFAVESPRLRKSDERFLSFFACLLINADHVAAPAGSKHAEFLHADT